MINSRLAGRPYRHTHAAIGAPGWFLFDGVVKHDLLTGREGRHRHGAGVFGSKDDGYLITMTTDTNAAGPDCPARPAAGPRAS
ncbi:carotenoid cleavage dioxygenase [Actinokineospora iranica]|uniref:Carotenoid cleavage dioxygenase n=2 Tax=Actinokineospora iranica TaxID=1271860 RepID=A0A1G6LSD5_9PSEU|nr:carotenoid cleavage dioxygenase [Actinokineospora iranica]